MTVYTREQWGSTGAPGGYDILGPVAEVSGPPTGAGATAFHSTGVDGGRG